MAVIADGARLLAVGDDHTVVASEDGEHWAVLFSQPGGGFSDIASFAGRLVAAGDGIWDSSDGRTWIRRIPEAQGWRFGRNGPALLLLGNGDVVWRTTDGVSWQRLVAPGASRLGQAVWDGRRWVAVGDGVGLSDDGSAWDLSLAGVLLGDVAWTGQRYLAVGCLNGAGLFLRSGDGQEWQIETTDFAGWYSADSLSWNGSQFLVTKNQTQVATSPDGVSWSAHDLPRSAWVESVLWAGGRYVGVGPAGVAATSPDGTTWTGHRSGLTADIESLVWTGTEFLATGNDPINGGALLASGDGSTWRDLLAKGGWTGPPLPPLRAALEASGRTVAVGEGGVIIASGVNGAFSRVDVGVAGATTLRSIAAGAAGLVAVGEDGAVVTSPDGTSWERRDALLGTPLYALVWTGNRYVAVGGSTGPGRLGAAFVSSNARDWKSAAVDGGALVAVAAGSTALVAIQERYDPWWGATRSQLSFSSDGSAWTPVQQVSSGPYVDVTWNGSSFLLIGGGSLLVSDDGRSWVDTGAAIPGPGGFAALASDGSRAVLAGVGGMVLRSVCASRVRRHLQWGR